MRRNGFESRTGYQALSSQFLALGRAFWQVTGKARLSRSTLPSTHHPDNGATRDWYAVMLMSAASVLFVALSITFVRANDAHATVAKPVGYSTHGTGRGHRPVPCSSSHTTPYQAIDCVWPARLRAKAKRVAECESTASASETVARRRGKGRWARDYANGTHWGVFQLGPDERRDHGRYQIGSPAITQVRSAYDLYTDRGWDPWKWSKRCWGR